MASSSGVGAIILQANSKTHIEEPWGVVPGLHKEEIPRKRCRNLWSFEGGQFLKIGDVPLFCCHRALRLEIFSLDIISFFFPKFLCMFGKEFAISSLSNFTKHEFVISLRSRRRPGRQTFLLGYYGLALMPTTLVNPS